MSSFSISISSRGKSLYLHAPINWTVSRLKELILMYHSESPPVRSQVLSYKSRTLSNSDHLKDLFSDDLRPELILTIEQVPEIPEHLTGYKSELFKIREEEYLKKYNLAKQLLLDNHHKSQDSGLIPTNSVISSLPLTNPEFKKRVRALAIATKRPSIRLRSIPFSVYVDFWMIIRWIMILAIAQVYLNYHISKVYYLFGVVCYLLSLRTKIDEHLRNELRRLPREYLVKVLPERFHSEPDTNKRISVIDVVYETTRAFFESFLPWFDPVEYRNRRNLLYR